MTGEIGQLALCLALALSLVQAVSGLIGARLSGTRSRAVADSACMGVFIFVALAFASLMYAFVTSDFSVLDVAQNSHTAKPLIYKITGVWGNHEGSMVLWVFVLAAYSVFIGISHRGSARLTSGALGVQGLLATAFLVFILLTSDPFTRIDPAPFEGAGLNPLLQDPGLAFHPPMLYLGYVGLSASFAYAAAALITSEADANWARSARPFMLVAWIALTLGITLGSWWAYYVLGWGGFWFWDPVENASLMPWLVATALLHSALATERSGAFRTWTLLLAISAFSLSLIGTFLVRSGVVTSVHAFANDPERGVFILVILSLAIGGALALFAWRAPTLDEGTAFEPVSRETALLLNNVLLVAAVSTVFIGTVYPIVLSALGTKLSVGAPYFNSFFVPLFAVLLFLVPFGPRLAWRRADLGVALRDLWPAFAAAILVALVTFAIITPRTVTGAGAFALGTWLIGSSGIELFRRRMIGAVRIGAVASALAHAGLGITLLGVAGTTLWKSEAIEVLSPGEQMAVGTVRLRFDGVTAVAGPNFEAAQASVAVMRDGRVNAVLHPEKRIYPAEQQETVNTAILTNGLRDLYVALGDDRGGGRYVLRAYLNPLAPLIWGGGGLMALGGLASLIGRLQRRRSPVGVAASEVAPS